LHPALDSRMKSLFGSDFYNRANIIGPGYGFVEDPHSIVYHIAISYASQNRDFVSEVASILKSKHYRVFFDKFETHNFFGANLYTFLAKIYSKRARTCAIFISEHYVNSDWTKHELASAQERALRQSTTYILPLRFDSTEIDGLNKNIGFIDIVDMTPLEVAEIIERKLRNLRAT
jgi:hypothetical protein